MVSSHYDRHIIYVFNAYACAILKCLEINQLLNLILYLLKNNETSLNFETRTTHVEIARKYFKISLRHIDVCHD